jgi:hypothetical protein
MNTGRAAGQPRSYLEDDIIPREETDPLAGRLAVPLAEAARLLGISPRHARDLVAEGVVEVVELGSKRVVAVSVLRRLLGETSA